MRIYKAFTLLLKILHTFPGSSASLKPSSLECSYLPKVGSKLNACAWGLRNHYIFYFSVVEVQDFLNPRPKHLGKPSWWLAERGPSTCPTHANWALASIPPRQLCLRPSAFSIPQTLLHWLHVNSHTPQAHLWPKPSPPDSLSAPSIKQNCLFKDLIFPKK